MSLLSNTPSLLHELQVSLDGYEFRKGELSWRLNRNVNVLLSEIKELASPLLFEAYIQVLSVFATTRSALATEKINYIYRDLLRFAGGATLNAEMLEYFRNTSGVKSNGQTYLKILVVKWFRLKLPGVDADMVREVNSWQIEGGVKGDAVRRLDPEFGPFTDTELQGLIEAFARSYESGTINIVQFSMLMVLQATGRRPWQLMNMRLKDLIEVPVADQTSRYIANVPRIKQRGSRFRQEFRKVELIKEVWNLLQLQCEYVIQEFEARLGVSIPKDVVREMPLFFSPSALRRLSSLDELKLLIGSDTLHMKRQHFFYIMKTAVTEAGVLSERTNSALHVFARRFRYTIASRAAREGFGLSVIAELLDHSNNDSAFIYTLNVPEHGAHIDRVVGKHLAAVANAFAGRVVKNKTEAVRGLEPGSDIRSTSGQGSGTCGNGGACRANVPIPCYTCHFFQPWLDGPHEEFHAELIAQRIEILDVTGDAAVATALDRTIQAVAEVIAICTERKTTKA